MKCLDDKALRRIAGQVLQNSLKKNADSVRDAIEYGDWYMDGDVFVVFLTGQPQDSVMIGLGDTPREAAENLESTAIQSTGRDNGLNAAMDWAEGAGYISSVDDLTIVLTIDDDTVWV